MLNKLYRLIHRLRFRYPWRDGIGGWELSMHYDLLDPDDPDYDVPPYINVWEHKDGRKAQEGPGFCSDPDLAWFLLEQKKNEQLQRSISRVTDKICFSLIASQWLLLIIQGSMSIPNSGAWFLFSLIGYALVFLGLIGSVGYLIRIFAPRPREINQVKFFIRSVLAITSGYLLINIGKFDTLYLGFYEIEIFWFGIYMGLINVAIKDLI